MGFLIKSVFWLSLVLLLIPFGGEGGPDGQPAVGPVDTFLAARGAFQDISGMCERRPEVCEVGKSAFSTIGSRAREGARIAMTMLEDGDGPAEDGEVSVEAIITGSVAQISAEQ